MLHLLAYFSIIIFEATFLVYTHNNIFNLLIFLLFIFNIYQAEAIAAFARMTVDDSRKILPNEFYPSWVVFSQRQKLS